ncbi:MAG: hypothetical protein Q8P89_00535 [bacterium]|nr:hypothetical protein [bacterium]
MSNLPESDGKRKKTLQEELEELWDDKVCSSDGPPAGIELPEGMRAIELAPDRVVLRSIVPGLPPDKRDVPVAVFDDHCLPEEVRKVAEEIFQAVLEGKVRYRERTD